MSAITLGIMVIAIYVVVMLMAFELTMIVAEQYLNSRIGDDSFLRTALIALGGPIILVVYLIILIAYKGIIRNIRKLFRRFFPSTSESQRSDEIRPYVGYRVWRLQKSEPKLLPLNCNPSWTPGTNIAQCFSLSKSYKHQNQRWWRLPTEETADAPAERCLCGFHSKKSIIALQGDFSMRYYKWPFYILGSIVSWGKVIPGENGMRAEKACIAALYVPPEVDITPALQEISAAYGIPLVRSFEELTEKAELMASEMAGLLDHDFEGIIRASY